MCERNSALGIVTMSNLQMRRSIASLRNCITNRMRSQDSESSERLLSFASVPDHIHTAYALHQLTALSTAITTSPGSTRSHIHRILSDCLRHTNRARISCSASQTSKKTTCDLGSPRHFHIGRSAADHMHVATCHSALPTLIKLLLSLLIVDCFITRHADDDLRCCQVS